MMEMQVDSEPASVKCVGDTASLLLEVEEDYLPASSPDGNPRAVSDQDGVFLEPHVEKRESSLVATSKESAYYRRWESTTPGVYVPSATCYSTGSEGKVLDLYSLGNSKDSHGLKLENEVEENFIILVDISDDENLPPQLEKTLSDVSKKCGGSFQDLRGLQELKQFHMAGSPYWCSICGKEFFRAANLRMHKLTHSTERPHKCPVCNKGFIRTADVWRHLSSFHRIERSSVVLGSANIKNCWSVVQEEPDNTLNTGQLFCAVRKPEESSKSYLCPICNKSFSKSNLLSKHKVIHRQDKPYKCKECGMAFVQLARLKRHHQTHTGERPFHCEDCGNTFTRLGSLKRHHRIHTGEKPYSCSYCNLSFSELGTLRRHEQIHIVVLA
ncbi:uncharacterized protein LOC110077044 [Pogona vitticeps]